MSPAVANIRAIEDSETRPICLSCFGEVADSALKCCHCESHIHFRCSMLPDYQLIRFSVTQSSYSCQNCVKVKDMNGDEESYGLELTKVMEIKTKEVSILDQVNATVNSPSHDAAVGHNPDTNEVANSQQGEARTTPVCKYYLQKSCKHGKKGEGCKFSHPKLCFNFIRRGNRRGGCRKGEQCTYVHPKLCTKALETKTCSNKKCRFYHVTGTKFSSQTPATGSSTVEHGALNEIPANPPPYNRVPKSNVAPQQSNRDTADQNLNVPSRPPNNDRRDFLEVQQQIKAMQEQLFLLISLMKPPSTLFNHPPPTTGWMTRQ